MAAIYMWFYGDVQVLTTTLYPVDVTDNVQLTCDILNDGWMNPVPEDAIDFSGDIVTVNLNTILLEAPVQEENLDLSGDIVTVTLNTILLSVDMDPENLDLSGDIVSVQLLLKLVIADTPDESLQLTCDILSAGCSMTPV